MRIFLVKNYLQFFAEEFVLELALLEVDSFEASTFLEDFVIFEDFLDCFPAFEFLPNIIFTSYIQGLCLVIIAWSKNCNFIHKKTTKQIVVLIFYFFLPAVFPVFGADFFALGASLASSAGLVVFLFISSRRS